MPNSERICRTIALTKEEIGPTTATKSLAGSAMASAKRSGAEIAQLFGSTSAKMTRMTVIASVASATPELPNSPRKRLVAIEEDRILARLLPMSSAPISRSRRSINCRTKPARSSPLTSSV
ncbi:hypothetical protein ACVIRM_000476 [Rhizobium laguerreae]